MARNTWVVVLALVCGGSSPARGEDEDGIDSDGEMIPAFDLEDLQAPVEKDRGWTPPPVSPQDAHRKLDSDKDGRVSKHEFLENRMPKDMFVEHVARMFKRADGNPQDGAVSFAEASEMLPIHIPQNQKMAELKFKAADKDANGSLDADELLAFMFPRFSHDVAIAVVEEAILKRDSNADGALTVEELFGIRAPGQQASRVPQDEKEAFKELDIDGDGVLNAKELAHSYAGHLDNEVATDGQFGYIDTDGDGYISVQEAEEVGLDLPRAVIAWNGPNAQKVQRRIEL